MKYLIKVMAFCHCFVLFASTQNVFPFPIGDSRLSEFKQMCEELAPIVKSSAAPPTCFLSYAWPEDATSPLRSWFDAIHYYLTLAGIHVLYDVRNFTGDVSKLEELARSASKMLIILTPDYKTKCDRGTTLRNEIRIAFSKGIHNRSLVVLSGSVETGLPFEDIKGSYVPGNEMINLMVPSDFRDQKPTDGPCIEKFYGVICSLLDPTHHCGLLNNVSREHQSKCKEFIRKFLESMNLPRKTTENNAEVIKKKENLPQDDVDSKDSHFLYNLAKQYLEGKGVEQDIVKSIKILKQAADLGLVDAMYALGIIYNVEEYGIENPQMAVEWLKKSMDCGHIESIYNLGNCYAEGKGVSRNIAEAIRLWKIAADGNLPEAQCNLALSYLRGEGVLRNNKEAIRLFKLSADQGNANALYALGRLYELGLAVEKDSNKANDFYRRAAEKGHKATS